MEIVSNGPTGFKLRGKKATAVIGNNLTIGEFIISGPGEYEVAGIDVFSLKDKVYRLKIDGLNICFLSRALADEEKSAIGTIDILITVAEINLDASLEPAYVIPFGSKESVSKFAKEVGSENLQPQPKLVTSAEKLPDATTVIVLA